MVFAPRRATALASTALWAVALLGQAGACSAGDKDDDDRTVRSIVGPISDFPSQRVDAGSAPAPSAGASDSAGDAGSANGGSAPPLSAADAGIGIVSPGGPSDASGGEFGGSDAGTSYVSDAGDPADAGDAGEPADAGDAAAPCIVFCP